MYRNVNCGLDPFDRRQLPRFDRALMLAGAISAGGGWRPGYYCRPFLSVYLFFR
jgi:hypothetical protein